MTKPPLPDHTTIQIDYPGSKEVKKLTLGQLKEFLKGEDPDYRKKFFELLETTGTAYGRIARYKIVTE